MSKATDLAQAEATRAEAETPDTEPTEPTEPTTPETPTPDPGEPQTDEEGEEAEQDETSAPGETPGAPSTPPASFTASEALGKKLDTERARHRTAMKNLLDSENQAYTDCPVCFTLDQFGPIVEAVAEHAESGFAGLAAFVGVEPVPDHNMADGVKMCDHCNGWGELDHPTRNPHMKRQMCPACAGNGYVPDTQAEQPTTPVFQFPAVPPPVPPAPQANGANDQWGRPSYHPHYGLDPAQVMP